MADVFTVGAVAPVPPTQGGVFGSITDLTVGEGSNNSTNDIWGYVSVDDGTLLQYGQLIVGDEDGFFGRVEGTGSFLDGIITRLNFSASGSTANPTIQIGNEGTGWLDLRGGTQMTTVGSSGSMTIGRAASGVGYATVSDQFTLLTLENNLFVGQNGMGTLTIENGAIVRTINRGSTQFVGIGTNALGIGTVVVDGQGALLSSASSLVVSGNSVGAPTEFGQGTLRIRNGGIVDVDNGINPRIHIGPLGRVELEEGTLIGFNPVSGFGTTVRGYLGGSGLIRGSVELMEESFVEANAGDLLRFSGLVDNRGSITVDHGEIWFLGEMANRAPEIGVPPGRIALENGTIRFSQLLENDGVISSAAGANNIHGLVINNERVVVARDTVATFYDFFDPSTGMVDILPGGNAIFLADLIFDSMSTLQLEVGANTLTDTTSPLSGGGSVSLAGTLDIQLDNGYTPKIGETFELISADGGMVGSFDTVNLPTLSGDLELGLIYNSDSVLMEVRAAQLAAGLAGDYNDDGVVDAADYTVWRNHLNQTFTLDNEHPDAATKGYVDQEDYGFWKANYGQSAAAGAGGLGSSLNGGVPEPSCLMLLAIALGCCRMRTRRG